MYSGRPDIPRNCTIFNQTTNSLHVECLENFDGGLPQKFTVQVESEASPSAQKASSLIYNHTSESASFLVGELDPGTSYQLAVFASNAKGRSQLVRLRATTLNLPERRTGEFAAATAIT